MARLALVCIASLLAGISAGPLQSRDRDNERRGSSSGSFHPIGRCHDKDNVFRPGQTYEYKYFGKAETGLGFSDSKVVGLAFDCHVQLSVPEPCEFRMKVTRCDVFEKDAAAPDHESRGVPSLEEEVRMMEQHGQPSKQGFQPSDKSEELSKAVSEFDIQAQISNGEVVKVIYEESEDMWVVNFKKGILDSLQIRTDTETPRNTILVNGVHGLCPTRYTSHGGSNSIIEDKDIDSCIQATKKHWELSPLTPVWNMSLVSNVMNSRSICSYKLRPSSHIEKMVCKETHKLLPLPWSSHIAAMTANVTTTLQFVREAGQAKPMDRNMNNKEVTSILYEHDNSTGIDREEPAQNDADDILDDLVKQAIEGFDIGSPAVFDDFVTELRQAKDLTDLVQKVKAYNDEDEEEVAKNLLVQGLIQCNAPACLRALTTLIQSQEIPSAVFEPVVMALALTKQTDPLFLAEITNMCEASPSRTCALMIGALTNKLLTDDDDDTETEDLLEDPESREALQSAIKFLVELLDDSKCEPGNVLDKADDEDEPTKTIIALKALGNLGSVAQSFPEQLSIRTQKIEQKIAKCLTEKTPHNVTIAAISAFRKFVPNQFISDRLLNVLADKSEPHEVRIAACMQSLRMAKDKTSVRNIVKVMENEPSEQIKAFMVSHLRSVMQSEDPNYNQTAKLIKQVLQETGKTLPKSKARLPHSIHMELSKFYEVPFLDQDANEFGAQVESTVVFTPKSYMPKCIHFNVSCQGWSEYVNLLETGVSFSGTEDLVEKIVGPRGILSKSKLLRNVKESLVKILETLEDVSYKYLKLDDMKEYGQRAYSTIRSQSFEAIVDRILGMAENVDTTELNRILSHARNMDTDKILQTIKRYVPDQSAQLEKVVEKLKRINLRDVSEDTLVEILEAFGIPERKCREILSQVSSYGVNINEIIRWMKRQDLSSVQDKLRNLRVRDIQDGAENVLVKVKQFLNWVAEKYSLPDLSTMIEMIERTLRNPTEFNNVKNDFMSHRQRKMQQSASKNQRRSKSVFDEEDDEDAPYGSQKNEDEDDEDSLNMLPFGRNVKSIKRFEDEDTTDDDEDDLDITAFIRILGNEIGFISLSDILPFFDTQKLMQQFNVQGNWKDVMDGFDVRPTIAAKAEAIHHVTTGLGLPLQITLNVTGIATLHLKMDPQGSFRKSALEIEPSAAIQVAGGMAIDLPTIHKIEAVSNTTIASEFEMKVRLDIREKMFEMKIEKPDEELDIFHIRHELKLVKDDEDFEPFPEKGNQVDKQKCLPQIVESVTGLKVCAELETSTLRGSTILSHGPHELKISVKESQSHGPTDHYKFSGKYNQESRKNTFDLNFEAPSRSQRRQVRALLSHDRSRNDIDMDFEMPDQKTPKMKIFVKNLGGDSYNNDKYGFEIGADIETTPRRHYNASVTVIGKISGGSYGRHNYKDARITELMEIGQFNYTLKGSVQTPVAWINVSTTTAKLPSMLLMEHNLTYFISENVRVPILKKLRFPNAEQRHGVSKFVIRHGLKAKTNDMAYDLQAFAQFLTFPLMSIPEPTVATVAQIKVNRDGRHVGLHLNNTWINSHHEMGFLNASITTSNINSILRLSEPATIRVNISRNDWFIGGKAQLRKESSDLALQGELTASGNMPECSTMVDCVVKRLKTEARCLALIFKPTNFQSMEPLRPHHPHKLRTRPCDNTPTRHKQVTVSVEGRLRQKSGERFSVDHVRNYRDFSGMKSMAGHFTSGQVWELKANLDVKGNFGTPKQLQSTTTFGNDIKDRSTMLNLFVIHNMTATNIPYGLNHFAQLMVSREEGLLISVNTSIDRSEDDALFGVGFLLQVDPSDKIVQIGANLDTPVVDGSASVVLTKPPRQLAQIRVITKTESDRQQILNHKLEASGKIGNGKLTTQLKINHPKVDTDMKTEIDLYSDGSSTDFDAGTEFDFSDNTNDDDNDEPTPSRHHRTTTEGYGSFQRKDKLRSRNNQDESDSEEMTRGRRRNVRSVLPKKYGKSNEDFETTTESYDSNNNEDDNQFSNSRDEFSSGRKTAGVRSQGKHQTWRQSESEESSSWNSQSSRRGHKSTSTTPDYESSYGQPGKKHHKTSTTPDYDNNDEDTSYGRSGSKKHRSTSTTPDYDNQDSSYSNRRTWDNTDDDSSVFGRKTGNRKTKSSSKVTKGSLWSSIFGESDSTTSQEESPFESRKPFSGRDERSQNKKHYTPGSYDDEESSWMPRQGQKWTYRTMASRLSTVQPKISSVLRIQSKDSEFFPTVNVEAKATIRQVSVEFDVRDVPRSLREVIQPGKFSVKAQIDNDKVFAKVVFGHKGEAGVELHIRSQREATGKIYDRGLTNSGETVHAQVTVTIPQDDKIQIKLKIDPESTSRVSRHVREYSRKAFDYSRDFANEYGTRGMRNAKDLYSNPQHSFYSNKYTKSYMPEGTMEDWTQKARNTGRQYYDTSKDYADQMYRDESIFGVSIQQVLRTLNEKRRELMDAIMDLIRDTPLGEWVEALPSFDRLTSQLESTLERHFSQPMRIIRREKSCILMQSCNYQESLQAIKQVTTEIIRTTDTQSIRDLANSALQMAKELLLNSIRFVKEKARQSPALKSVVGPLNLDELERKIQRMEVPTIGTLFDAVKTIFIVVKDLAVDRFDAIDQDRDGTIVLTIPHPFKWSSFKEVPRFTESQRQQAGEYYGKVKRSFNNYSKNFQPWNDNVQIPMNHRQKPVSFKWSDITQFPKKNMPSQTAMIFGDRHVMTFDGKVYAIPEAADKQCTYLLARGMKQKNFALVKDKDTVTITVPEMVISINEKNEVRVNNSQTVPLPLESPSKRTKVTLVGDTVEVESDLGLTVKVTGEKKVVVVELSMGLWDETSGLLGSNDNEASNDWEMPNGRNAEEVEDFLNAYEVGKSSQCKLVKGRQQPTSGQRCGKSTKCAQLFGGSGSPLHKCFRSVDPEEFKQACETESTQCGRSEADETVCNIVAAYRKACAAESIETDAPEECETCEGGRKEKSQWNVRGNQRKVDAVLLVSEHRDMTQYASGSPADKIRHIMDTVIRKLKSVGGNDIRVALVGFSGSGVHKKGHTHTINGDQFGTPEQLPQALRTLQFKGNDKTDALEAVEYILDTHDFRSEATKILLVFGAEEKEFSGHGDIQEVQEKLTEQGITLTVFSKYGSEEIKDRDHGINFDGNIFSSKPSSSSSSSSSPHHQQSSSSSPRSPHQPSSEMPRRKLSFLAKQSRGAVFQLDSLFKNNQEQVQERVAQVIADQVKREEAMCKRCVCKETELQQLISACTVSAC